MTRRWLLFLLAFLASALGLRRKALAMFFASPERRAEPRRPDNPFRREGKALVGVAGGRDVESDIRRAIELIGGLAPLELAGKSVLVKPNVVSDKPAPSTTSPEVVGAVVKILKGAGAKRVVVGDMSAMITLATSSTLSHMEKNGIRRAAEAAGAEVVGFEEYDWVEVPLPGARYLEKALVTEWLFNVDLVVNLPVIKTHRSASYSICLKNFIGCTHLRQRPYLVDREHWEEVVAEFNLAYQPILHIVDGTVSMIEDGPWEGTPARTGLIIASGDPVAADLVGLGIIGSYGKWDRVTDKPVDEQRQIVHARELGLGAKPGEFELLADGRGADFDRLLGKVREAIEGKGER